MERIDTYCVSNCAKLDCKKRLSYSVLRMCEARGVQPKTENFSDSCNDYLEPDSTFWNAGSDVQS